MNHKIHIVSSPITRFPAFSNELFVPGDFLLSNVELFKIKFVKFYQKIIVN